MSGAAAMAGDAEAERERLSALRAAELRRLSEVLRRPETKDFRRRGAIADLGRLACRDSIEVLWDAYQTAAAAEKRHIAEAIAATRTPEALPYLRRLAADHSGGPDVRWVAAEGIGEIEGAAAIPELRRMLDYDDPTVRRIVHGALVRLGDADRIEQVVAALRAPEDSEALHDALYLAGTARVGAAVPHAREIFNGLDGHAGPETLALKHRAATALLRNGDTTPLPWLVELVGEPPADLRRAGLPPPSRVLEHYTGQHLEAPGQWREWLAGPGKEAKLVTRHVEPIDHQAITAAALRWATKRAPREWWEDGVLYYERELDEPPVDVPLVRAYSEIELRLLRKWGVGLADLRSNGEEAYVRLFPRRPRMTPIFDLVLEKRDNRWTVTIADVFIPRR